jgi:hypothetical protein
MYRITHKGQIISPTFLFDRDPEMAKEWSSPESRGRICGYQEGMGMAAAWGYKNILRQKRLS